MLLGCINLLTGIPTMGELDCSTNIDVQQSYAVVSSRPLCLGGVCYEPLYCTAVGDRIHALALKSVLSTPVVAAWG